MEQEKQKRTGGRKKGTPKTGGRKRVPQIRRLKV